MWPFFVTLRTFFCLKIGGLESHNENIREFYLIVINLATRQSGKIFWKNTSNPNMRGSSTGVTSVTTNHRFSTNLRLFTKRCNFVPFFFSKSSFWYGWKLSEKWKWKIPFFSERYKENMRGSWFVSQFGGWGNLF